MTAIKPGRQYLYQPAWVKFDDPDGGTVVWVEESASTPSYEDGLWHCVDAYDNAYLAAEDELLSVPGSMEHQD